MVRIAFILLLAAAAPALAQSVRETPALSAADLMRRAAPERASPSPLQCCDWGGSCEVYGAS